MQHFRSYVLTLINLNKSQVTIECLGDETRLFLNFAMQTCPGLYWTRTDEINTNFSFDCGFHGKET